MYVCMYVCNIRGPCMYFNAPSPPTTSKLTTAAAYPLASDWSDEGTTGV